MWTYVGSPPADIAAAYAAAGAPPEWRGIGADRFWWGLRSLEGVTHAWRGFGDASSDLAAFDTTVAAGDTYNSGGEWQNAVTAYQAAGQTGATTIGPEIDAQTGGASQPLTQQAWAINGNLASVNNTSSATQSDAESAQGFVRQMQNIYHKSITMQPSGGGGGSAAPSAALLSAAQAVVDYFGSNGCSQASLGVVTTFQAQYNAEGQTLLTVDGKYGPNTQAAVQRVLDASGGGSAPADCFTGRAAPSPRPVTPATPSVPAYNPPAVASAGGSSMAPWLIGGAAVLGAGAIGYALWRKKKKRAGGHHRTHAYA